MTGQNSSPDPRRPLVSTLPVVTGGSFDAIGEYSRIITDSTVILAHPGMVLPDHEGRAAMGRRLRYIGTNSGNDGCPTLYEYVDTGNILVCRGRSSRAPKRSRNFATSRLARGS